MVFKKGSIEKSFSSKKSFYIPKMNSLSIIVPCLGLILFAVACSVFKADNVTLKTLVFELHTEKEGKPK